MKLDMTYEESVAAFPAWIAKNRGRFAMHYTATEAALLARMAGFDPMFVQQTFCHYQDTLAGTNITHRAIRKVRKATDWMLSFKMMDLAEQWESLGAYLTKGEMWPTPSEREEDHD